MKYFFFDWHNLRGDGQSTFALPNFQGRVVVHQGQNPTTGTTFVNGQMGGVETVTLNSSQLPAHTHQVRASSLDGTTPSPENAVWAKIYNIRHNHQKHNECRHCFKCGRKRSS